MLRMTPHLEIWRPCDAMETAIAWQQMLAHNGPSVILLTRQNVPQQNHFEPVENVIQNVSHGAYIIFESNTKANIIIIATGSEVALAVDAAKQLAADNIHVRVVSMLCCERFKKQSKDYREKILPKNIHARLAIEAGAPDYWYQFVGDHGKIIGINHFGASAPQEAIWKAFGFTVENVKQQVKLLLAGDQHD